jgi:hypothetical protein
MHAVHHTDINELYFRTLLFVTLSNLQEEELANAFF